MKRLLRLPSLLRLTLVFLIALVFQNCSEQKLKETTDETLNITSYLRENEDYSMFLEILDITNYASFMNTYGTYTIFVPNNDAVKQYLTDIGATSLSEVPLIDLQNIAKLHILDQKVKTTDFTDGKIAVPSLYGQYLVTGAANKNDVSRVTVNKIASIVESNIVVGNGVIHVIDKVLRIADKTLAQTIEANPDLSLFTEVLKATGWFEKLNKPLTHDADNVASYLSVIAQTNEVYNNTKWKAPTGETITLNTLANLKRRYSHLGDPTKLEDSLNLYVSYRVVPGLKYLADFAVSPALETMAPLEVISSKLSDGTILLNDDVFNGVLEKGVAVNRTLSDVTASNGVLHFVDENFAIKKRVPVPVYWEFTDIAEFRKVPSVWRVPAGGTIKYYSDQVGTDLTFDGSPSDTNAYISYDKAKDGTALTAGTAMCWHADVFNIYRFRDANVQNVNFKTPVIIKGQYKLWISYRANGDKVGNVKVFFDGKELARQVNLSVGGDTATEERVLESQGYKRYLTTWSSRTNCRLVGIIDVKTTSRHTLTLQSQGNFGNNSWFDMAEFRPVGMDQLYPKFKAGLSDIVPK